ncbi:MAG: phenylalanine--tRNA ligase subunit beta, partial [Candidatus Aminicenantes bacterium]|nr:phenylalanine--tRNA ligase subunit beta [Candidatus Aminicenantes bacterium]
MRINLDYLKKFIDHKYNKQDLKELLASIGIEVNEMIEINGRDVFEVEITPNRPDWLSHYGIAREIHAKNPSLSLKTIVTDRKKSIDKSDFRVEIKDRTGCSRYSGVILNNVKVGKSSPGLTSLIESFGLRSVNNIVDISNLVLMTYGHPIHIFDLDKITGDKIIIRSAEKDEVITLLDGMVKKLDVADLVIADENKSIAVAGVMGEEHSGVSEKTVNIFIESAWFDPSRVRITSKKMGMKTEASYLFERGADVENTSRIIDLTIDRIEEELGYQPEIIQYFDEYPEKLKKQIVELDKDFPEKFTGIQISEKASTEILESLGFKLEDEKTKWKVEVPSFRVDINKHEDLVEEIIRIYGYDKLDTTLPATAVNSVEKYEKRGFLDKIRSHFAANGYSEVINYSFHSLKDNSFFGDDSQNVELRNPIGSDYSVMRNSLLSGILKNTATNSNNDFRRISLFESGTVFSREGNKLIEKDLICISSSGFET